MSTLFFNQQEENIFNRIVESQIQSPQNNSFTIKRNSPKKKQRDQIQRRLNNIGKPGTKRHNRYMNAKFLRDLENDLNLEEFTDEILEEDDWFNCSSDNPFYFDFGDEMIDITEEKQRQLLNQNRNENSNKKRQEKVGKIDKNLKNEMCSCVDKNGYSEFISSVEQQIVEFLQYVGENMLDDDEDEIQEIRIAQSPTQDSKSISQTNYYECEMVFNEEQHYFPKIIFSFTNSFQRRLCHGISQYYGIQSKSFDDGLGKRKTIISLPKSPSSLPQEPIVHYLRKNKK